MDIIAQENPVFHSVLFRMLRFVHELQTQGKALIRTESEL